MDNVENTAPVATDDVEATFRVRVPTEGGDTEPRKVVRHFNTERSLKTKQHSLEKSHMQLRIREHGVKAPPPTGALTFASAEQVMSPLLVRRMKSDDQVPGTAETSQSHPHPPTGHKLTLPLHDMQRRQSHDRVHRVTSLGIQAVAANPPPNDQTSPEVPQSSTSSSPLAKDGKQNSVDNGQPPRSPKVLPVAPYLKKQLKDNQFLSTPPTIRRYPQQANEKNTQPRTTSKTLLLPAKQKKSQRPGLNREKSSRPRLSSTQSLPLSFSDEQTKDGEEVESSVVPLSSGPPPEELSADENISTVPSLPPINVPVLTTPAEQPETQKTRDDASDDGMSEDVIGQVANENVPNQEEEDDRREPVQDLATRVEKWINKLAFTTKSASYGDLHTGRKLGVQGQNSGFSRGRSLTMPSDGAGPGLSERGFSRPSGSQETFVGLTLGSLTEGLISPRDPYLTPSQRARFRYEVKSASCSSLAPSRDPRESIYSEGVAAPPEGSLDEEAPVGPIRSPYYLHPSTCSHLKPCNVVDRIEATTGKKGVLAWLGLGTEDVHRIMRRASLVREEQERMRKFPVLKTGNGTTSSET
ncbi:Hypp2646 [Branchiostoma lanceolatum]|uniref:Hypp2646 protein n=1 Tax=Branchiostoma lanceolatum TaxID=7740 RepID=A0A8K0ETW9_BRALA|nr:Hypp2646 [Branchiostoma lanceolatum]